jgi:hypothetical protein
MVRLRTQATEFVFVCFHNILRITICVTALIGWSLLWSGVQCVLCAYRLQLSEHFTVKSYNRT